MNSGFLRGLSHRGFLVAILLALAFCLAGWKTFNRLPASDFSFVPEQVTSTIAPRNNAVATGVAADFPVQQLLPDGQVHFNAQFVSSSPGKAVHAASLVELKNSDLRAVWFSGSREGAGDVSIQTAVMEATSQQWGKESTLFERQKVEQGLWRYVKKLGNPVIARAPDGSLSLWMVNVSLGGWAGSAITWSRSTDEGITWSRPRRLVTSPFLNISTLVKGAPVALKNGQTALPVYHEFVTKFSEILRITPQGQVVDKTRIPGSRTSLQPIVLVTSPQNAQTYMRSGNATAVLTSATQNGGKTWSSVGQSSWPNPDSALAGVVTNAGVQWLAINPSFENREILALLQVKKDSAVDAAKQWNVESSAMPKTRLSVDAYKSSLEKELEIHGVSQDQAQVYIASAQRQLCGVNSCAQEFSYPYLLQSRDGFIHVVYTWHRTRIKHVRFDPLQPALAATAVPVNAAPSN